MGVTKPGASGDSRLDEAEQLLADLLARRVAGEDAGLDALIGERPDLASELRQMWSQLGVVDQALEADARQTARERTQVEDLLRDLAASKTFGERYAIEGEIGRGGMGAVLRALDKKLDRPLALKLIVGQSSPTRTGKTPPIDARQLTRFLNEARVTSQLDHPGIVPVHEVGVDEGGRAYFTMKLVQGSTLSEVFERRAAGDAHWSTARVLGAIQRVCEAMAFAHDRGVIHRDLKPHNVMVGDFG
ncbi:MAG: serine/threonine protein kinase, partial [Actinobacteria bacterium]|nr:serine/threonine protein kinase [Actinomycetota bacterium]